jgi:hypothetical protein
VFIIRDVMHCKPGKVGELVKKFSGLNPVMKRLGYPPARVLTDVSGEPFWTAVFELEAPSLDGFRDMEAKVMADKEAQDSMAGYHELVREGRREIFKVED